MYKFTVEITPRTKKNSSQAFMKNGRMIVIPSKLYKQFENDFLIACPPKYKNLQIDYPINLKATYYVESKRKIDLVNLHSALHDVLVKAGVLVDDSAINPEIVVSTNGSRVYVDKSNPRIEIEITRIE